MTAASSPASSEDDWPQLEGRREPENLSVFDGDDRLGLNALTLASRIGTPPMPWQVDNLLALLRTDADGMWTHADACIICPRQNGKSEILLLLCLYALFVRGENIVFSTQQWKTARKLALRFSEMVKAVPDLKRMLARPPTLSQGQSIVSTTMGNELIFCTRSGDTGKGLDKVDRVIYDEAYNLTEAEMTGPTLAQTAAKNPQTIYTSSAVFADIHQNGQVLAGIRRNGLRKIKGLYFAEYMAPEPPRDCSEAERKRLREDPMTARLANPSFGVIHSDAKVAKSLLGLGGTAVGRRSFEVDVLGWGDWPADAEVLVSEIPEGKWRDMRNPSPKLTGRPAIGLHCDPDSGIWAIVGAQRTDAGPVHIEYRPPLGKLGPTSSHEVVRALVDLVTALDPVAVAIKRRGDAAAIEDDLIKAGIEPEMIDGGKWSQWCGGFLNAALDSRLSHSGQSVLTDAAGSAVRKDMPAGGFVWDEDAAGVSAPALFAATLAHGALVANSEAPKRKTVAPRSGVHRATRRRSRDFDPMTAPM
ncbi:phage terminase family protein [Mycobacterium sp. PSTR-4-N]|uniref:phage terminase family protein n=1 Tax=Mycobacterium sp. PSTR-4-N TaxID=2917745 RepID=UPI001F1571E3|nr:phage terminase family protein [Mycobacterium sp. PSTR-4-N]MCG7596348.1 phage terminase family protein [Mycobacterium sp. PSTR-4-N]